MEAKKNQLEMNSSWNELKPLNSVEIRNHGLTTHQLWLLQDGGQEFGPFSMEQIHDFLNSHPEASIEIKATTLSDQEQWVPLKQCAEFNRRDFKLTTKTPLPENKSERIFYILHYGQKTGPFDLRTVESYLKDQMILYTDLITWDEGNTWHKIYECEQMDRRKKEHSYSLPKAPAESLFTHSRPQSSKKRLQDSLTNLIELRSRSHSRGIDLNETTTTPEKSWFSAGKIVSLLVMSSMVWGYLNFYHKPSQPEMVVATKVKKSSSRKPKNTNAQINSKRLPASTKVIVGASKTLPKTPRTEVEETSSDINQVENNNHTDSTAPTSDIDQTAGNEWDREPASARSVPGKTKRLKGPIFFTDETELMQENTEEGRATDDMSQEQPEESRAPINGEENYSPDL